MRIGILSLAHHHAESYIQTLRMLPGVEVIGLADDDPERGQKVAGQLDVHYFSSYQELLAEKPDGVVVCSENSKHRALVEMAAASGVNVLCEKPLATTMDDGWAMVRACEKAGVILMTAFPMRFSPPLLEVKNRLDSGELGKVFCFNSTNQGEMPARYRAWFVDRELAGGGAVMDHTVHLTDVMRWYLNKEVVEVYAQTNRIFHAGEVDVETGGLVMLSFSDGTFASIDCSWSRPDFWPSWGGLTFEMVTDRGAVVVDGFKQNLTVYRRDLQRPVWEFWGSDSNLGILSEFVAAIYAHRQPSVTGLDGLRALEVALAAYRSAESGQPVRLGEDRS